MCLHVHPTTEISKMYFVRLDHKNYYYQVATTLAVVRKTTSTAYTAYLVFSRYKSEDFFGNA